MLDDSIMITIWINCSIGHKVAEDSLVCALIYILRRRIFGTNHINVVLFVDVFREDIRICSTN